ncbi:MAG: alpha/beta hydrolase [Sandarakinorhabdus sp.]|nr:alpha/beta hydrolase [Sandarakinorhabdus sp.]
MNAALARRRTLPAGAVIETRVMADGWHLRSAVWQGREGGPGSILFLTGRGDFLEKYAETFHDLVDAGWGVATFDWRGQGLSGRLGDMPMKGHTADFDVWLRDLDTVIGWFQSVLPRPWFGIGHSLGGHLLLRHLAGENNEFARAVLLAPMLGVSARPLGAPLARRIARLMTAFGRGGAYVWRGGPYVPGTAGSVRQVLLTSDPERYVDEGWWTTQNPALALGSVTWGWLAAAFASLDALLKPPARLRGTGEGADTRPRLQRITTPVLVLVPKSDGLVDGDITRDAVSRMPSATLEVVAADGVEVGHELLREASGIRAQVLARVTGFLQETP